MKNEHLSPRKSPLGVGEPAPDFTLKDQNRDEWNLREKLAESDKGVVLCFYPLAFTGVCGTEMECINSELARWHDTGYEVVGVSCDSFAANKAWADQLGLQQTLLADMHRSVCKAYGLYWAELNIASRGTVVIEKAGDGSGRVKWVQAREPGSAMDVETVMKQVM